MIIIVYSIILLLCVLGVLLKAKNRLLQYVILILIIFLMGRGALTYDMYDYYMLYQSSVFLSFSDTYEPGYLLLEKIGRYLYLDYVQFRIVIVAVTMFMVNRLATKILDKNVYYFYLFYTCFFIFIDTVQLRSFISFSIVLYGLNYLFFSKGIKTVITYVFFVAVASTIHISSLAYIVFLLTAVKNKKTLTNVVVLTSVIGCLAIFFGLVNVGFVRVLLTAFSGGADRLDAYGETAVNLGFMYAFVLHLMSLCVLYIIINSRRKEYKFYIDNDYKNNRLKLSLSIVEFVFLINLISIVYFPLYMFDLQFLRLSRSLFLLNIMVFPLFFSRYKYISLNNVVLFFLSILLIVCWLYFYFVVADHVDSIIVPFFNVENILS